MLNKVLLLGNLTRDVELRYLPSGAAVAKFGLATNRRWKDKNTGEDKEEAMFIDVNVFGRSAEIANQYLAKGRRVFIEGRLVLERWNDQNGQPRSKHIVSADSINFVDSKTTEPDQGNSYQQNNQNSYANSHNKPKKPNITVEYPNIGDDDDIPF